MAHVKKNISLTHYYHVSDKMTTADAEVLSHVYNQRAYVEQDAERHKI